MKNIRQGVFETNSSSSHSISISHMVTGLLETIHPNEDGNIHLEGGEYGWEYEVYCDPYAKANYCAIDVYGDEERSKMLKKVIKDHTGAKEVFFDFTDSYNGPGGSYSYIDHQSRGCTEEAFLSEENLKMFIFNPDSTLTTDNDNH